MDESALKEIIHDWNQMLPIYEEALSNSTTASSIAHYEHMVEFAKRRIKESEDALHQLKSA